MLDKIKSGLNLSIIFVFMIALIYFIVVSMINLFSPEVNKSINITTENINIYTSDAEIVTNYTTFFNVEAIIQNIIMNLNKENYQEIYSAFSTQAKQNISKDYFMKNVAKYVNDNFKYSFEEDVDEIGYKNYSNLKMLYSMDDNEYIAVVKSNNATGESKFGIKLINNNEYAITYLEL
jgi:hypothetical protein